MTQQTDRLQQEIDLSRQSRQKNFSVIKKQVGYNTAVYMMTDMISCILVGLGIGLFLQKFFHTSSFLTFILTILGGIAGIWTTIRYAMAIQKLQDKK